MQSKRTFGVEIEFLTEAYLGDIRDNLDSLGLPVFDPNRSNYDDIMSFWNVKCDSSIDGDGYTEGVEICSPILSGESGIKAVRKVVRALAELNATINTTCGLHVHIGAKDLTPSEAYTVLSRYAKNESQLDSFMHSSRHGEENDWCLSAKGARFSVLKAHNRYKNRPSDYPSPFRSLDDFSRYSQWNGRYNKVNTAALHKFGTIEFRHHHGSVDEGEIVNWIKFLVEFVEVSRAMTTNRDADGNVSSQPTFYEIDQNALTGISQAVRSFYEPNGQSFLSNISDYF